MDNFLQVFLAVTGGGGIGFILNYLISSRKTDQDEFKLLIETWREDNERLRQREITNSEEIRKLSEDVAKLKNKLVMLESAHFDLPLPQWIKDVDGTMLSVNSQYESTFLEALNLTAIDYVGKTDYEIWGAEAAHQFNVSDKKVIRTKKPFHVIEDIPDGSGGTIKYEVFKYPRFSGNVIIGIGGIAIREDNNYKQGEN